MEINKKIVEIISELGVQALCDHLGSERVDRLNRLGQSISSNALAEIMVSEHGLNIFRKREFRLDLLCAQDPVKLKQLAGSTGSLRNNVVQFNEFNWGDNAKSKLFLDFFGLDYSLIASTKIHKNPIDVIKISKPLHLYQNWIRKKVIKFLNSENERKVIIHMPTGSGKTRTTMDSVCDYIRGRLDSKICVVWFAHSEELCEQAVESFFENWERYGSEDAQVVRLWGGSSVKDLEINKPTFVVTSFQTAYKILSTKSDEKFKIFTNIRSKCKLLIIDEAHKSTAKTYKAAIELFSSENSKIIGLTATPGRHHVNAGPEESIELANFYDNRKIDIVDNEGNSLDDPISFLTNTGVLSEVTRYQLNSDVNIELSSKEISHIENLLDIPKSVLDRLGKDEKRTNLIATHALKLVVEKGFQTIIFAPSKENAIEISTLLKVKGCNSAVITGETFSSERYESIKDFKAGKISVLVNFGVLTTGFDAPNIRAVIIARPTTSVVLYSQMLGRGIRGPSMGGTGECYLVDVIDNIKNMPDTNQSFTFYDSFYKSA